MNNFEEMEKTRDEENRENAAGCSCEEEQEIDMELLREIMIFAEMARRKEMERRSKMRNKLIAAGAIFAQLLERRLCHLRRIVEGVPILTSYLVYFLKITVGENRSSPTAFH